MDNTIPLGALHVRVFLFRVILVSSLLKIILSNIYWHNKSYNLFKSNDIYYRSFQILKLTFLTLLSYFTESEVVMYLSIALNVVNSLYLYHKIVYFLPEAELCCILAHIWGWISVIRLILRELDVHFSIVNVAIFPIAYFYFYPHPKFMAVFEVKIMNLLKSMRVNGHNDYQIYLFVYYAYTVEGLKTGPLSSKWSNKFRFYIANEIIDSKTTSESTTFTSFTQKKSTETSLQTLHSLLKSSSILSHESPQPLPNLMFLTYFFIHISPSSSSSSPSYIYCTPTPSQFDGNKAVAVYQMYYMMIFLYRNSNLDVFKKNDLEILFGVISRTLKNKEIDGVNVEYILKYERFNMRLEDYLENEHKFLMIVADKVLSLPDYRQYLDTKISLKKFLKRELKLIEFVYPHSSSFKIKSFIMDRYIDNNELLSQENFTYRIIKEKSRKNKFFNLSSTALDPEKVVFLCDFLNNKGLITHYNKNFQIKTQKSRESSLRVNDLIPEFWQAPHEQKLQELSSIENFYTHNPSETYYITLPSLNKSIEITKLKVIPYCELSDQILALAEMKIDLDKDIKIIAIDEDPASQSYFSTRRQLQTSTVIYENEEEETVGEVEKIQEIFGKKYLIRETTELINFATTKILNEEPSILLDNVNAIVGLGLQDSNKRVLTLEKGKDKVNIFKNKKIVFLSILWCLCLIYGTAALLEGISYDTHATIVRKGMVLEMNTHRNFLDGVNFEAILITVSDSFPFKNPEMNQLFSIDADILTNSFRKYKRNLEKLIIYSDFIGSVFGSHDIMRGGNVAQLNYIGEVIYFGIFLEPSNALVKENIHDHWIITHYRKVLAGVKMGQKMRSSLVVYSVIAKLNKMVLEKIHTYNVIYWCSFAFMIFCSILGFYVYWNFSQKVTKILTKPLLFNERERNSLCENFKNLAELVQNSEHPTSKQKEQESPISLKSKASLLTMQLQSSSKIERESKQFKGNFYNIFVLFAISFALVFVALYIMQTWFVLDRESTKRKLAEFDSFASFNTQLFSMFDDMLEAILDKTFTPEAKRQKLETVSISLNQISTTNIVEIIEIMFFDRNEVYDTLYGNPCLKSQACSILNRPINPYPRELNYFISKFYELFSYVSENLGEGPESEVVRGLVSEAFASARSIAEMNAFIFDYNDQYMEDMISGQKRLVFIFILIAFLFVAIFMFEMNRFVYISENYGKEIVSFLPSRTACETETLQYEINSILYRNNFAKEAKVF